MARAIINGVVLAESSECKIVDGNHYFPPDAIRRELLTESDTRTTCSWKGEAHYYHVLAGGETIQDAAWYYPVTKDSAKHIEGYVAFWKSVTVKP